MFSYSDHRADASAIATCASADVGEEGRRAQRLEHQAAARTVLLAHRLATETFHSMLGRTADAPVHPGIGNAADKAAVGEVSLQFGVSRTKAGRWVEVGELLDGLPKIRDRFLAGDYSFHRVSTISHALTRLSDARRHAGEDAAIDLAERPTTDPVLRDQLDELVIDLEPEQAADDRELYAERHQDVTISSESHGHSCVDACVTAEHGVFLRKRISAMTTERLCSKDPRTIGQQRVAALAELHGVPGAKLCCECGRVDCPRVPAPANESVEVAPHPARSPRELPTPTIVVVTDPAAGPTRLCGYGAIDPIHAAELAGRSGVRTIIASLPAAGPAPPIDPTGHGGHDHPPPGALTYAPSRRLREEILSADHTCRYPYCGKPADECELDHVVPFDPTDPQVGGWTVPENIIPLCRPDHQRKHTTPWTPTMGVGREVIWRNHQTGQTITTYPR